MRDMVEQQDNQHPTNLSSPSWYQVGEKGMENSREDSIRGGRVMEMYRKEHIEKAFNIFVSDIFDCHGREKAIRLIQFLEEIQKQELLEEE